MLVCGNDAISTNKFDAIPQPDIYIIPRTPDQADSISDVYEPSQGP